MRVSGICKSFGQSQILADVSLEVGVEETVALLGPSGCGKTTLLRIISGLERPAAGSVEIDQQDVTTMPPHRRQVGFVFQELTLYPHLTVGGNLEFPLRGQGVRREPRQRRARDIAELVGVGEYWDRYPHELSGGQRQRVAIGRALVPRPRVLLLDEPLAHLDSHLKTRLRGEIADWTRASGASTIYVTHDVNEAMAVANRIAVMVAGRLHQVATADQLYHSPADRFVARLVNDPPLNFIQAREVSDGTWMLAVAGEHRSDADSKPTMEIGFRVADTTVALASAVAGAENWIDERGLQVRATAVDRYRFQNMHWVVCDFHGVQIGGLVSPDAPIQLGESVLCRVARESLFTFELESGKLVSVGPGS